MPATLENFLELARGVDETAKYFFAYQPHPLGMNYCFFITNEQIDCLDIKHYTSPMTYLRIVAIVSLIRKAQKEHYK